MRFNALYDKVISIPHNYGDLIINFLTEDKTLNFLQSLWIIVALLAGYRTMSIARRIQRRHYREKYYSEYKDKKVGRHKKWVKEEKNTDDTI